MIFINNFWKKCLSSVLSVSIVFSIAIQGMSAKAQTEMAEKAQDDLVIVLDLPKNISNSDSIRIKNETIDFCKSCVNSNNNLQISIIDGENQLGDEGFTKDLARLEAEVNSVEADNKENLAKAVESADKLLKNEVNSLSKKIFILTDADYTSDDFINGTAQDTHMKYSNYAEHIKNSVNSISTNNVDVYTIGLFLDNQNVLKAEAGQILQAIQTKGYHEINDLNNLNQELENTLKDLTKGCPIIFVPGIMGSRLYADPNCKDIVWAPEGSIPQMIKALTSIRSKMKVDQPLYVNKPVDQNKISTETREYGATQIYKNMIDSLCERFPNREIYFFSYDFRKTNIESGRKLDEFIDSLGQSKVDIIAHSMGGLVTSNYISEKGNSKVDKIIIQGAPLEGAPQLVNAVMHWEIAGDCLQDFVLGLAGLIKESKASYPATAEMYPTKSYFNQTNFFERASWNWRKFAYDYKTIDYKTYEKYGKVIFSDNYEKAVKEQEKQNIDGINVLASIDNSYFVFGTGMHTVKSVKFKAGNTLKKIDTCQDNAIEDLIYETIGDGTVPHLSYTAMDNVSKKVDSSHVAYFDKMNHTNIAGSFDKKDKRSTQEKQAPINWALDVLEKGSSDKGQSVASASKSFTVLKLDDNAEITVKKDGKVLSSDSNDFSMISDFGRLDFIGENNATKILAIDDNSDYEITMNAKQAGDIDYSVRWYDEAESLTEERDFVDVPVTENTKIITTADRNAETKLSLDINGDGSNIQEIVPAKITKNENLSVEGLSDIKLSEGKLCPEFKTETLNYEVLVDDTVNNIDITPKPIDDSEIIVSENGTLKSKSLDGRVNIALRDDINNVQIKVQNKNGNSLVYSLKIIKGTSLSAKDQNNDTISLMSIKKEVDPEGLALDVSEQDKNPENNRNKNVLSIVLVSIVLLGISGTAIVIFIKKKKV